MYLHIHTQQIITTQSICTNTDSQTPMGTFKISYRFSEIIVTCDYRYVHGYMYLPFSYGMVQVTFMSECIKFLAS